MTAIVRTFRTLCLVLVATFTLERCATAADPVVLWDPAVLL